METSTHSPASRWPRAPLAGFIIISLALLAYTTFRAATLSFTHDESLTFNDYVVRGPIAIFDCYDANNHPLNTALMILSRALFGTSELALRLPSVLAHVMYLVFAGLLARRMNNVPSQLTGFILLTVNPYLLDFFSLARGYAWALAALLGSLHYLMAYYSDGRRPARRIAAFNLMALSVFANYAFFICYLAVVATYLILEVLGNRTVPLTRALTGAVQPIWKHIVLHLLILLPPMINLNTQGALYFGGTTGFLYDTVGTPVRSLFYDMNPDTAETGLAVGVLGIVMVLFWGTPLRQRQMRIVTPDEWVMPCTLSLVVAGSFGLHMLLQMPSPMDRSAIFLLPLFSLALISQCTSLQRLALSPSPLLGSFMLGCGVGLALPAMISSANLTHTRDWKYDADTQAIVNDLAVAGRSAQSPLRLGASWVFEPTLNFYRSIHHLNWLMPVTREGPTGHYDYSLYTLEDAIFLGCYPTIVPIRTYPVSGATVAKFETTPVHTRTAGPAAQPHLQP